MLIQRAALEGGRRHRGHQGRDHRRLRHGPADEEPQGPIWLGLTDRARSIRPYAGMGEIRRMVARSAYAQLGYSPLLLLGHA